MRVWVAIAGVFLVAGCSGTHRSAAPTTSAPPTTTAAARAAPEFGADGLAAAYIPAGFVPVKHFGVLGGCSRSCVRHVNGPLPGWTNVSQQFWSASTNRAFVISLSRGQPATLAIGGNQAEPYAHSPQRVGRYETFVRTELLSGSEREFTWVVGPTTTGFVGGFKMTDGELLRIANGLRITA